MTLQEFTTLFQQTVRRVKNDEEFLSVQREGKLSRSGSEFTASTLYLLDSLETYKNMVEISLYHIATDKERLLRFDDELRKIEQQAGVMSVERAASIKFLRIFINKLLTTQLGEPVDIPSQQS